MIHPFLESPIKFETFCSTKAESMGNDIKSGYSDIMVIGVENCGKTTFLNTLLSTHHPLVKKKKNFVNPFMVLDSRIFC